VFDELNEEMDKRVGGPIELTRLIQNRVKDLNNGAKPLVDLRTDNKIAIAKEEIRQGKISGNVKVRNAKRSEGAASTRTVSPNGAAGREGLRDRNLEERDWWKGIATHPIGDVVGKLGAIPREHLDAVLDRLLQLPASDAYIHNEQIQVFLRRKHSRLTCVDHITGLVVIAHIGWLVANDEYTLAQELLKRFPENDQSALGTLVAYLRFVSSRPVDLAGTTHYSTLSEEDLFLGACYYGEGHASETLESLSRGDYESYESLANFLSEKELNDFKVRGLQPRIAELAFRDVYRLLHGAEAKDRLRDLNLECIKKLAPSWSLKLKPILPPADWRDENGVNYDVKSNLFYRSQRKQNGLRGFLIKITGSSKQHHSFPGIMFTDTDDGSCSWVYVGDYHPTASMGETGDRILPFFFQLPDSVRCDQSFTACDSSLGMLLLKDPLLRIGWQLATGRRDAPRGQERTIAESLLDTFVERCLLYRADTFLEYALWKALTETTLDACCRYDRESVRSYLELANKLISSQALPIRLPRIADTPILSRWITDILQPLNDNWSYIQCCYCRCSARELGVIRLQVLRMTSAGTIKGQMTCTRCSNDPKRVTLLTHCYERECHHYPLIIGKNPMCIHCGWLVCEWRDYEGNRCKSCKPSCRQGKDTSEDHFVRDSGVTEAQLKGL
jgi:DNA-directed RNA polymerase subunit omega